MTDTNRIVELKREQLAIIEKTLDELQTKGQLVDGKIRNAINMEYYNLVGEQQKLSSEIDYEELPESYRTDNVENCHDFLTKISDGATRQPTSTGFSNLDRLFDGGLHEGLYLLGAIASFGKTSLCCQIADFIAESGTDVLIFSFEMSAFELYSRTMSRLGLEYGLKLSNRDVMTGSFKDDNSSFKAFTEAHTHYKNNIRPNLFIVEVGLQDYNAADIRKRTEDHIRYTGKKPIVIIDYLQIVAPFDVRATDKQNMDKTIVALKRISRDFELPVIAVSSLNRASYNNPISYESFKESGAIEYSADVLMGLQLAGVFNGISKEDRKQLLDERSKAKVKDMELVVIKNRSGRKGDVTFTWNAVYNQWTEQE